MCCSAYAPLIANAFLFLISFLCFREKNSGLSRALHSLGHSFHSLTPARACLQMDTAVSSLAAIGVVSAAFDATIGTIQLISKPRSREDLRMMTMALVLRFIGSTVLIAALITTLVGVSIGSDFVKFPSRYTDLDGTTKDTDSVPMFIIALVGVIISEIGRGIALVLRYGLHVGTAAVALGFDTFAISFLVVVLITARDSAWTVTFMFGLVFNIIATVMNLLLDSLAPSSYSTDPHEHNSLIQQQAPDAVAMPRVEAPADVAASAPTTLQLA